jgi:hypothetical protein
MGRNTVRSMTPLLGTSDFRPGLDFLIFNEGVEEADDQVMEWEGLGVIMRAIFIP